MENQNNKNQINLDLLLNQTQLTLNPQEYKWMSDQIEMFIENINPILKFVKNGETYSKNWQITKLRPDIVEEHIDINSIFKNSKIYNKDTGYFEIDGKLYGGN